jgi:hypothetical protein
MSAIAQIDRAELWYDSSLEPLDHFTPKDRERLIELGVQFGYVKESISELKQGIMSAAIVSGKDMDALDNRIRMLENFRWLIMGGAGVVGAIVGALFHFLAK